MADEELREPVTTVVIRHADDRTATEDVIAELASKYTSIELLHAIDRLSLDTSVSLIALVERLDQRRRDIDDLMTIAKSARELSRKVERLAQRLLAEERTDA